MRIKREMGKREYMQGKGEKENGRKVTNMKKEKIERGEKMKTTKKRS